MDTVFKEIMEGYERQLASDKREQRKRILEIHDRIPRYKELEDRTADVSAKAAILAASGQRADAATLLQELTRITDEKKRVLAEAGVPAGYLSLRYACPDCKDTGYIGTRKCHCLMQKMIEHYYSQSGLYDKLRTENFDTFSFEYYSGRDLENIKKTYSAAKEYVETFADTHRNMLFYGSVGCGKSFMSSCIAKALMDKGIAVTYISAVRLFDILSAHMFGREASGSEMYNLLFSCPLLIIDDLGTEIGSSAVSSGLFSVLNERGIGSLATIISTNYSLDELQDRYSDRSLSRILGGYEIFKFSGDDIRLKKTEVG